MAKNWKDVSKSGNQFLMFFFCIACLYLFLGVPSGWLWLIDIAINIFGVFLRFWFTLRCYDFEVFGDSALGFFIQIHFGVFCGLVFFNAVYFWGVLVILVQFCDFALKFFLF